MRSSFSLKTSLALEQSSASKLPHGRRFAAGLLLGMLLVLCGRLSGQSTSATLTGSVTDGTGAIVSGAAVSITQTATGIVCIVTTNDQGIYNAPQLAIGEYSLKVTRAGFSTATRGGVYLQINQTADVSIVLAVGSVDRTVAVSGLAPLLQTDDVSLGTVACSSTTERASSRARRTLAEHGRTARSKA